MLRILPTSLGVAFWIHVNPRAKRPRVGGCHGDALRVAVTAPPVDGEANAACVAAVAGALGVKRSAVDIDPASRNRRKRVQVRGDTAALTQRLAILAEAGDSQ